MEGSSVEDINTMEASVVAAGSGKEGAEVYDVMQRKEGSLLRRGRASCCWGSQWLETFVVISQERQRVKKDGKDFLVRKCLLRCYHEQSDEEPYELIDITFSRTRICPGKTSGQEFCFELKLSKHTLMMSAESSEELTAWTESIQTMTENSRSRPAVRPAAKKANLQKSCKDLESDSQNTSPQKQSPSCSSPTSSSEKCSHDEDATRQDESIAVPNAGETIISLSVAPESVQISTETEDETLFARPVPSEGKPGSQSSHDRHSKREGGERQIESLDQVESSEVKYMA